MEELDDLIIDLQKVLGKEFDQEFINEIKSTYGNDRQAFFNDMVGLIDKETGVYFDAPGRIQLKRHYNIPLSFSDKLALSESRSTGLDLDTTNPESSAIGPYQITRSNHESTVKNKYGVSWDEFSKDPKLQDRYMWELDKDYDKYLSRYKNYPIVKDKNLSDDQIKMAVHVLGPTGAQTYLQTGDFTGSKELVESKRRGIEQAFSFLSEGVQAYEPQVNQPPTVNQPKSQPQVGGYNTQIDWSSGTVQVQKPQVQRDYTNQTIDWTKNKTKPAVTVDGDTYLIPDTRQTVRDAQDALRNSKLSQDLSTKRTTIDREFTEPTELGYSWGNSEPVQGLYELSKNTYSTRVTQDRSSETLEDNTKKELTKSQDNFLKTVLANIDQTPDSYINTQVFEDPEGTIQGMGADERAEQEYRITGADNALNHFQQAAEILIGKLSVKHPEFDTFLEQISAVTTTESYQKLLKSYPNITNDPEYMQYEMLRQKYGEFKNFKDDVKERLFQIDPETADLYRQKEFSKNIRDKRLYNLPLVDENEEGVIPESVDVLMRNAGRFIGRVEVTSGGILNAFGAREMGGKLMRRGQDLQDLNPKDSRFDGYFEENFVKAGEYKIVFTDKDKKEIAYVRDGQGNQVQPLGDWEGTMLQVNGDFVAVPDLIKDKKVEQELNWKVFSSAAADTVLDLVPQVGGTAGFAKLAMSMGVGKAAAYTLGSGLSAAASVRGSSLQALQSIPELTQDQRENIASTLATFTGVVSNINPLEKNLAMGIFSRTTADYIKKNAAKIAAGQMTAMDIAKFGATQVVSGVRAGIKETGEESSEAIFEKVVVNPIVNYNFKTKLEEGISSNEWKTTIGLSATVGMLADVAGNIKLNFKDPLHRQAFIFATQDPEIFQSYVDGVKKDNPEYGAKIEEVFSPIIQELSTLDKKPTEAQVLSIAESLHEAKKLQDKINTTQNPVRKKELEAELESVYTKLTEKEKEVEQNKEEVPEPEVTQPTEQTATTEEVEVQESVAETTQTEKVKAPSFTSTQKVGDYVDTPVIFEGKRGTLQTRVETDKKGNEQTFYTVKVGNQTFDLGDVNADTDLESAGLDLADAVNVTPEGVIEIRGQQYQNLFDTPTTAIDRDGDGNYVVRLDTVGDKPEARTFRGQIAEDLAYQITLQEITRNNNEAEFEQFIEQKDSEGQIPEPISETEAPADGGVPTTKSQKQAVGATKNSQVGSTTTQGEKVAQNQSTAVTEPNLVDNFEPTNTKGEKITGRVFTKEEDGTWRARKKDKQGNLTAGTKVGTPAVVEQLEAELEKRNTSSQTPAADIDKVNKTQKNEKETSNKTKSKTNNREEGQVGTTLAQKGEKVTPTTTVLEKLGTTESKIKSQIKKFFTDTIPNITEEQSQKLADANFIMWKAVANTLSPGKALQFMRRKVAQLGIISTEAQAQEMSARIGGDLKFQIIGEKGAAALDAAEESSIRLDNLQVAREMESAGKDPKTIRLATGWERGKDGKWRYEEFFEIDYQKDIFSTKVEDMISEYEYYIDNEEDPNDFMVDETMTLEEIYGGQNIIFKSYPELKSYTVTLYIEGTTSFSKKDKGITINVLKSKDTIKSLYHEVQHAIQSIEGFSGGTSFSSLSYSLIDFIDVNKIPDDVFNLITKYKDIQKNYDGSLYEMLQYLIGSNIYLRSIGLKIKDKKLKDILTKDGLVYINKKYNIKDFDKLSFKDLYINSTGEVEARNAAERQISRYDEDFNFEELLSITEDVSRDEQIVDLAVYGFSDELSSKDKNYVGSVVESLKNSLNNGDIKLSSDADTTSLPQVAENIVNNAIDHLESLNKKGLELLRGTNDKESRKNIQQTIQQNKQVIDHLKRMRKDPKFSVDEIKQDTDNILKAFHGTSKDKDFKKFKDTGKGVFVTIDPRVASDYASENDSMKFGDYDSRTGQFKELNTASRVIPLKVNLGNSYKLTTEDLKFLNSKPNYGALQKELHSRLKREGYDSIDYGKGNYAILTEGRLNSLITNEVLFSSDAAKFRGAAIALANGQHIVAALESPTPLTLSHELFHVNLEDAFTPEEKQTLIDEYNEVFGDNITEWNTDSSEYGARLYERFLSNGRKLTEAEVKDEKRRGILQQAFDTFAGLMKELYNSIIEYTNTKGTKKTISLSPQAQAIFDRVTGITSQPNTKSNERQIMQEGVDQNNQEAGRPGQENDQKGVLNTPVEQAAAGLIADPNSAPLIDEGLAADLLIFASKMNINIGDIKRNCK